MDFKKKKCILGNGNNYELLLTLKKEINFNVSCAFFLIHEIPSDYKKDIINNMLQITDSKVVFIDYHFPSDSFFL